MLSPIKTEEQYESYLERAYQLMQKDIKPNSHAADELELLSILIQTYENEHHPIDPPHPIVAILFRLDQMNMQRSELTKILGSRSRVSEILSGKRKLSLHMIRRLNEALGIPASVLIQDYEVTSE